MDIGLEYELDEAAVKDGVWFRLLQGVLVPLRFLKPDQEATADAPAEFRLRPTDTFDAERAMTARQRPHRKVLESMAGPAYEQALLDIQAGTLADAVVVDWRNVEVHGEAIPYSREAAFEILKKYPRLRRAVDAAASAVAPYRPERDGAAVGN